MTQKYVLTVATLVRAGMPYWDVAKFKIEWPEGCEITPGNFIRAEAIGLSPSALFGAVCPNKAALDAWSKWDGSTPHAIRALEEETKMKIRLMQEEAKTSEIQRKCDLLIDALNRV